MWRLVGNRPDDDVGAVVVATNHVRQLLAGIVVGLRVTPGNRPIDGNFRPHQYTHAFGLAHHFLVVRIVSQTNEVAAQFLGPSQQCAGVLHAIGTTSAIGFLVVDGDALQEDRLAVQQNLFAACLDGAETDGVNEGGSVQRQVNLIELGVLRTPKL